MVALVVYAHEPEHVPLGPPLGRWVRGDLLGEDVRAGRAFPHVRQDGFRRSEHVPPASPRSASR
eukprot:9312720-Pyramimonas_sp.AAC.2